jgi:hypothetical protein
VRGTRRWFTAVVSVMFALGTLAAPQQAMADSGTTLYVDNLASTCTDSGTGTESTPFCTIQAAANVAAAGDTVLISGALQGGGLYAGTPGAPYAGGITITNSGTASAPIIFKALGSPYEISGGNDAIEVLGDHVEISGADVVGASLAAYWMGGTADVLDSDQADTPGVPVDVGGGSDLTVERSFLTTSNATVVSFAGRGSGSVLTTNTLTSDNDFTSKDFAVLADAVSGVDITSNTISIAGGCGTAIGVINSASDVSVENNLVSYANCAGGGSTVVTNADLRVDSPSTASTTVGYNVFSTGADDGLAPYVWADTTYATPAAFTAATGQDTGDSIEAADLGVWSKPLDGPAAGSANASAPGELATDAYGNTWSSTPNRGAVSYADVTAATLYTDMPSAQQFQIVLDLQGIPWAASPSLTIDWGDGDGVSNLFPGLEDTSVPDQTTDFEDYLTAGHMYARPGTYTVTVTLTDAAQTITRTTSVTMTGSTYVPVSPTRILDTRRGVGAPKAVVGSDQTITVSVTKGVAVPAGIGTITAVVMNVTVTDPTAAGDITVYPDGGILPKTSNVNYSAHETVPNLVTVEVGADGKVDLDNSSGGSTDLVGDVEGYYAASTDGDYYLPNAPDRLLDTRKGTGGIKGPVAANATVSLAIPNCTQSTTSGKESAPATAVAMNVTVTGPTGSGYISAYPDKTTLPSASNVNYSAHENVPNMVVVKVGSDGKVDFHNTSGGTVQLVADMEGCYSTTLGSVFVPLKPVRILDTRDGTGQIQQSEPAGYNDVAWNQEGGPAGGALQGDSGLVLNVTVTQPQANGLITVYPSAPGLPTASNLNFSAGETVPNLVMVAVDFNGAIALYNGSSQPTDLIADLFGYFT